MSTTVAPQKITYTSTNVDLDAFHRRFDDALAHVRSEIGRTYPLYIDDVAIQPDRPTFSDTSPDRKSVV